MSSPSALRYRFPSTRVLSLLLVALVAAPLAAQKTPPAARADAAADAAAEGAKGEAPSSEPPSKGGGEIVKIEKGPLKIDVDLEGVLVAEQMAEVALRPESWSDYNVLEAVPHGTEVRAGDVLVRFDSRKIDEALADLVLERKLAELAIRQGEGDLPHLERSLGLELAAATRTRKVAAEDRKRFAAIDRPLETKSAEFGLKSATDSLEYATEELRQLEKMYQADELTEETEEIILKRQRNAVERAHFYLEQARVQRDKSLEIELPRREEMLDQAAEEAELGLSRARDARELQLSEKRFSLEKEKLQFARSAEKLAKLQEDRELMVLRAPADGLVYYGRCVDGKWPDIATLTGKLRLGGKITANTVAMTVVGAPRMYVQVVVPEKELHLLRPGMPGRVIPTALPDLKLSARLVDVTNVPVAEGKFHGRVAATGEVAAPQLRPGMTCKVRFTPYSQAEALTLPEKAVREDPLDDTKTYVELVGADGNARRRDVQVGRRHDGRVEIVSGLSAGDRVVVGGGG